MENKNVFRWRLKVVVDDRSDSMHEVQPRKMRIYHQKHLKRSLVMTGESYSPIIINDLFEKLDSNNPMDGPNAYPSLAYMLRSSRRGLQ